MCFTEKLIDWSVTQVGHSDPVIHNGMVIAQEIKVTLGINLLSLTTGWNANKSNILKLDNLQHNIIGA